MDDKDDLLKEAIYFHGHLGPYLVLGLIAGKYANEVLGREPMKTHAIIESHTCPPQSCFADGIQLVTGCTLGKNNICIVEAEGLKVTFERDDKRLTLKLREEIINEINSLPDEEEAWESYALSLYRGVMSLIFSIDYASKAQD